MYSERERERERENFIHVEMKSDREINLIHEFKKKRKKRAVTVYSSTLGDWVYLNNKEQR